MAAASIARNTQQTVLVVGEEPDVGRFIRRILANGGVKIVTASSGVRALRILGRTRVDLVVLDVRLRDISGTEVLRRLRAIDAEVPVIVVTSHGSTATVRAAMELGALEYLTKPFDSDEIEHVVHEALACHAPRPTSPAWQGRFDCEPGEAADELH